MPVHERTGKVQLFPGIEALQSSDIDERDFKGQIASSQRVVPVNRDEIPLHVCNTTVYFDTVGTGEGHIVIDADYHSVGKFRLGDMPYQGLILCSIGVNRLDRDRFGFTRLHSHNGVFKAPDDLAFPNRECQRRIADVCFKDTAVLQFSRVENFYPTASPRL